MSSAHQDAALQLMVLRAVGHQLKEAAAQVEQQIRDQWDVDDRIVAKLPDDTRLGRVELRAGQTRVRVVDEDKLAAWVADRYPTEVETVTRVRPAFLDKLKKETSTDGDVVVTSDGELVPGLEASIGDPTPVVTGARDAAAPVVAALRAGDLSWAQALPELEHPASEQ